VPWLQLSLDAGDVEPETLSAFFEAQGALSVSFADAAGQPLFEPAPGTTPLWSATRLTALFDQGLDLLRLKQRLAAEFGPQAANRLKAEPLADRDWERAWLDQFRPMRFGERLWVCPAGQAPPVEGQTVTIDLDPGLAFGTGTHPTTALCLEWLDAHPPAGRAVLDYGCGSGILAVAALKLRAKHVWAVDIDEQALWSTRENAARNGVEARLDTALPGQLPPGVFDLVLANILANPLIELAPVLAPRVSEHGDLVLSGILENQAAAVSDAYRPWFSLQTPVERDGWVRLHGVRKTGPRRTRKTRK
jgi:ribosomal protein L11 methyltransferase